MSIKKGDMVMVITGRDKGKTGKVFFVNKKTNKVLVEHLCMVKRHQKPTQKYKQGGIIEKEAPIHISNVMYYDDKQSKPSKLGYKILDNGKKVRVSKKSGEVVDAK